MGEYADLSNDRDISFYDAELDARDNDPHYDPDEWGDIPEIDYKRRRSLPINYINVINIKVIHETDKSWLIGSDKDTYQSWYPKKLCQLSEGRTQISVPE